MTSLGTDGFGRSEGRASLRDFFEVDAKHIVLATLVELVRDGVLEASVAKKAVKDLGINPDKPNPAIAAIRRVRRTRPGPNDEFKVPSWVRTSPAAT